MNLCYLLILFKCLFVVVFHFGAHFTCIVLWNCFRLGVIWTRPKKWWKFWLRFPFWCGILFSSLDIYFLSYMVYTIESWCTTSKKHIIGRGKRRSESAWKMRLTFNGFKWSLRYSAPCMLYLIYLLSSSSIIIISYCCSFEICFSVLTFAIQNIYAGTLHVEHGVWLGVKILCLKVS